MSGEFVHEHVDFRADLLLIIAPNKGFDPNDPGYQLAVALGQKGAYTVSSVCFPVAFYGASAAGAAGGVAVANGGEIVAATVGDYATWYGRAVSWLSSMVGKSSSGVGTAIVAAPGILYNQASQFCSNH
jgi:hypothetical protein